MTSVAPATPPHDISASPGGCTHTQHACVAIFQTGSLDGRLEKNCRYVLAVMMRHQCHSGPAGSGGMQTGLGDIQGDIQQAGGCIVIHSNADLISKKKPNKST